MRIFRPRWLLLSAIPFAIALISKPASPSAEEGPHLLKVATNLERQPSSPSNAPSSSSLFRTLLLRLTPNLLQRSPVQARSPVETPPTAYLPYPPPPNYVWPPGPHTQYPPPSETNAPAGWYGGAPGSTGGQGNSGAGSAQGQGSSGSSSSSSSAPSLRVPFSVFLPNILVNLFPSSLLPPPNQHRKLRKGGHAVLQARDPVETPPTAYLPYPPPPNYQWPPGQNPQNEYPQPSEFDPPRGWYTGEQQGAQGPGNGGNPNANQGAASYPPAQQTGGGGGGGGGVKYGKSHVAWIVIVAILATALVVGGLAYWRGKKAAEEGDGGEKTGRFADLGAKTKFWRGWGKKGGKPPPAAAAADAPPAAAAGDEDDVP
ncbi:MAG: hypothetical protein Q9207_001161 [Kuettlingeria erythrocarpa]